MTVPRPWAGHGAVVPADVPGSDVVTTVLGVVLLLSVLAWYLASLAARLDRLHHRVESAAATLENQLLRRAAAARELATSGLLDPASALLVAGAAADAAAAGEEGVDRGARDPAALGLARDDVDRRESAESDLSQALRATLTADVVADLRSDPQGASLLADVELAARRALLARRFHNDAVSQAQRLRGKRVVAWARLAGHAPPLRTFEMDDEPPPALGR